MKRVLVVGQAPSRLAGSARAFDGASGCRLALAAGLTPEEFFGKARTENLMTRWPGKLGKGDAFDPAAARARARRMRLAPIVVLAGKKVAKAFGVVAPYLEWTTLRGRRVVVVPHPSGINRWWNDSKNVQALRKLLAEVFS